MTQEHTRGLLELLYHVSREVATALDLRTVLQRVLFEALKNVGGERGSIVVLDDSGRTVDATIVFGNQVQDNTTSQLQAPRPRREPGYKTHYRNATRPRDIHAPRLPPPSLRRGPRR